MGYLVIDDGKASGSSVPTKVPSTRFSEEAKKVATTTASKARSRLNDASIFVSQPAEMDVLCGQDKKFAQHPGNKLYRSLIAAWSERYGNSVNKRSKMRMTTEICECMKTRHKTRFLKPATMLVGNAAGSDSDESDRFAFRWQVLTDQAARDKISHALRISVTASRKRRERREKAKSAQQEQQSERKQQSIHPQNQPKVKPQVDKLWMASPQSTHDSMQSFACIPEAPPSHVWYGDSHLYSYEPLPVLSLATFNSSSEMTSLSSQLVVDDSDAWHADAHLNDSENVEPLPLSSVVCFPFSAEAAESLSQLLSDDSESIL